MIWRAAIALSVALCACAPKSDPAPVAVDLDCAKGFEALTTEIASAPGVTAAPISPDEPYRYFNSDDGQISYVVTSPGAPGHPAILKQMAGKTTGCPFGDRAGYDQLLTYLSSLNDALAK